MFLTGKFISQPCCGLLSQDCAYPTKPLLISQWSDIIMVTVLRKCLFSLWHETHALFASTFKAVEGDGRAAGGNSFVCVGPMGSATFPICFV